MRDLLGVRAWRQKPLRERLLPWPTYALLTLVCLGCGLYLLTSTADAGGGNPDVVAVLFFVLVPLMLYLAALSRRVRR